MYGSMTKDFKDGGSESALTTPGCKSNSCNTIFYHNKKNKIMIDNSYYNI